MKIDWNNDDRRQYAVDPSADPSVGYEIWSTLVMHPPGPWTIGGMNKWATVDDAERVLNAAGLNATDFVVRVPPVKTSVPWLMARDAWVRELRALPPADRVKELRRLLEDVVEELGEEPKVEHDVAGLAAVMLEVV